MALCSRERIPKPLNTANTINVVLSCKIATIHGNINKGISHRGDRFSYFILFFLTEGILEPFPLSEEGNKITD